MNYPLLTSLFGEVYLINNTLEKDLIHCGAIYIAPVLKQDLLRFKSPDGAIVDIRLPDDLLNSPDEGKAYGATLEVVNHIPPP